MDMIIRTRRGMMGTTHFFITFCTVMLVILISPELLIMVDQGAAWWQVLLGTLLVITITSGGALIPDIDNDPSTITAKLGLFGRLLSSSMGFISSITYDVLHTRKDKTKSKTHRLLWHTPFIWLVIGALFYFLIPDAATSGLDVITGTISIAMIAFTFLVLISIWVAAGFLLPRKFRFVSPVVAIGLTAYMLTMPASTIRLYAICLAAGAIMHVLEDLLTQGSVPILFPIPIKGKMWWKPWVLGPFQIYTGGMVEKVITIVASTGGLILIGLLIWKLVS